MKGQTVVWIALALAALLAVLAVVGWFVLATGLGMSVRAEARDAGLVVINTQGGVVRQAQISVTIDTVAYDLPARDLPPGETLIPWSEIAPGADLARFAGSSITAPRLGSSFTSYTGGNPPNGHASGASPAHNPDLP